MDNLDAVVLRYALSSYFSSGFLLIYAPFCKDMKRIQQTDKLASSSVGTQTWRRGMAEAVMVKLEELGVGAWLAQGDRVIRFDFCSFRASLCLLTC